MMLCAAIDIPPVTVGGERHGAHDRSDQEEQQKMLEQRRLRRGLRRKRPQRRLHFREQPHDLEEIFVGREAVAGELWDEDEQYQWQPDREKQNHQQRRERAGTGAVFAQLLAE
jgi:hypothetical protein